MKSIGTPEFWRMYHRLSAPVQEQVQKACSLFQKNPKHPGLSLERLRCDPQSWSVRITKNFRAVGTMQGDAMIWYWIGNHRDFDRDFPT